MKRTFCIVMLVCVYCLTANTFGQYPKPELSETYFYLETIPDDPPAGVYGFDLNMEYPLDSIDGRITGNIHPPLVSVVLRADSWVPLLRQALVRGNEIDSGRIEVRSPGKELRFIYRIFFEGIRLVSVQENLPQDQILSPPFLEIQFYCETIRWESQDYEYEWQYRGARK